MPSPRVAPFLVPLLMSLLMVSAARLADAQKNQSSANPKGQTAETTAGEKKAITASEGLEPNTFAIFDKDGKEMKRDKIDLQGWEGLKAFAAKICIGPAPISPKCVRCKDGEIICASVANKDR